MPCSGDGDSDIGMPRDTRIVRGTAQAFPCMDMDSTEISVYGAQEHSAYNGHFESSCYHPLLWFTRGVADAGQIRFGSVLQRM